MITIAVYSEILLDFGHIFAYLTERPNTLSSSCTKTDYYALNRGDTDWLNISLQFLCQPVGVTKLYKRGIIVLVKSVVPISGSYINQMQST